MQNDIQEILFAPDEIAARVAEIGAALTEEYAAAVKRGEGVVVVSVLRGAAVFMADLVRAIELPLEMDFMAVSSYGSGVKSSGKLTIDMDLKGDIAGKHVIIAEDILDTGFTLSLLVPMLKERGPRSVEVVTFLRKDLPEQIPVSCKHVGFECPNAFVVGYGLDYADRYRNLPYVGILKPEVYE